MILPQHQECKLPEVRDCIFQYPEWQQHVFNAHLMEERMDGRMGGWIGRWMGRWVDGRWVAE